MSLWPLGPVTWAALPPPPHLPPSGGRAPARSSAALCLQRNYAASASRGLGKHTKEPKTEMYYFYTYTYMSEHTAWHATLHEPSSILHLQSCAMDKWGGVLSLLRVLAQLKTKVSLLGVSATI